MFTPSTRCSTAPAASTRWPSAPRPSGSRRSGLTDHGVMNGAVEHYQACRKHGIKPIIGVEAYLVDDMKSDAVRYERNHLTLLARSDEGFRNLVKLSSAGYLEGYRRGKANVDLELLEPLLGGRDRPHGLPPVALLPPARGGLAGRRAGARGRPAPGVRRRQRLLRAPAQRHRRAGQGERGDRADRARGRAGRWWPRPTCTTSGARTTTTTALCSACRPRARSPSRS